MDPVTAIQLAAALQQFVFVTIDIGIRIRKWTKEGLELPNVVKDVGTQMAILQSSIEDLKNALQNNPDDFTPAALENIHNSITLMTERCKVLVEKISVYLPKEGDSTVRRVKAAIASPARDKEIKELADDIHKHLPSLLFALNVHLVGITSNKGKNVIRERLSGQRVYHVPQRRVSGFVKREDILSSIKDFFNGDESENELKVVILQGMGGQGKTQLALEYATVSQKAEKYSGIFWVNAATEASTIKSFEEIARFLKEADQTFENTDAKVAFAKHALSQWEQSWLIIFDSYDSVQGGNNPNSYDIREYFPASSSGHILISTRAPQASSLGKLIKINGMTLEQASKLFFARAEIQESHENRTHVEKIVNRLGRMPLAIDQAGAYLRENNGIITIASGSTLSVETFLEHYEDYYKDVMDQASPFAEYEVQADGFTIAKTAFTAWNMAYSLLKPNSSLGALKVELLNLLVFFNETNVSEEFFVVYLPTIRGKPNPPKWLPLFLSDLESRWDPIMFKNIFRKQIKEFVDISLVASMSVEADGFLHFSLHPLVRDWIEHRQSEEARAQNYQYAAVMLATTLEAYLEIFPKHILIGTWYYTLPSGKEQAFLAHASLWIRNFKRYKNKLSPQKIDIPRLQTGFGVEGFIVVLLYLFDQKLAELLDVQKHVFQKSLTMETDREIWDNAAVASGKDVVFLTLLLESNESGYQIAKEYFEVLQKRSIIAPAFRAIQVHLAGLFSEVVPGIFRWEQITDAIQELKGQEDGIEYSHYLGFLGFLYVEKGAIDTLADQTKVAMELLDTSNRYGGSSFRQRVWDSPTWNFVLGSVTPRMRQDLTREYHEAVDQYPGYYNRQDLQVFNMEIANREGKQDIVLENVRDLIEKNKDSSHVINLANLWGVYANAALLAKSYDEAILAYYELLKSGMSRNDVTLVCNVLAELVVVFELADYYDRIPEVMEEYQMYAAGQGKATIISRALYIGTWVSISVGVQDVENTGELRFRRYEEGCKYGSRFLSIYRSEEPTDAIIPLNDEQMSTYVGNHCGYFATTTVMMGVCFYNLAYEGTPKMILNPTIIKQTLDQALKAYRSDQKVTMDITQLIAVHFTIFCQLGIYDAEEMRNIFRGKLVMNEAEPEGAAEIEAVLALFERDDDIISPDEFRQECRPFPGDDKALREFLEKAERLESGENNEQGPTQASSASIVTDPQILTSATSSYRSQKSEPEPKSRHRRSFSRILGFSSSMDKKLSSSRMQPHKVKKFSMGHMVLGTSKLANLKF